MKTLLARIILLTYGDVELTDRIKYLYEALIKLAPIVFVLNLVNWWFTENQQFGTFMCVAMIINMFVGVYIHFLKGTFLFKPFIFKNLEMCFVVVVVYMMLEMLRYTAGDNLAGEIFRILIQTTTLLYPTSKVLKNVFIITKGKYPPKFLMDKLYNFEKNGDLKDFFKAGADGGQVDQNEDPMSKPIHAKPSLYAYYFESLKGIALKYGYNLVLHGSLNRDLDLIAVPWQKEIGSHDDMINEFSDHLGGRIMILSDEQKYCFPHGRMSYVINLNRGEFTGHDPQYYLDISVIPHK